MSWPLAANLSLLFPELPLIERVAAARHAGFDGVEIQFPYDTPAEQLASALAAAELVPQARPPAPTTRGGASLGSSTGLVPAVHQHPPVEPLCCCVFCFWRSSFLLGDPVSFWCPSIGAERNN